MFWIDRMQNLLRINERRLDVLGCARHVGEGMNETATRILRSGLGGSLFITTVLGTSKQRAAACKKQKSEWEFEHDSIEEMYKRSLMNTKACHHEEQGCFLLLFCYCCHTHAHTQSDRRRAATHDDERCTNPEQSMMRPDADETTLFLLHWKLSHHSFFPDFCGLYSAKSDNFTLGLAQK